MRSGVLLDTNVVIRLAFEPRRLSPDTLQTLARPELRRFVSTVSAIEMAVKAATGKLILPPRYEQDFEGAFAGLLSALSANLLDLDLGAISRLRTLPLIHRNPFDRLLIAQAQHFDLTLFSTDRALSRYADLDLVLA